MQNRISNPTVSGSSPLRCVEVNPLQNQGVTTYAPSRKKPEQPDFATLIGDIENAGDVTQSLRGFAFTCLVCGKIFTRAGRSSPQNPHRFCSMDCRNASYRGKPATANATFHRPESSKQDRLLAKRLIERLLKKSKARPTACAYSKVSCYPDAHHPDYSKPDEVIFLSRSAHMRAHHDPAFERSILHLRVRVTETGIEPIGGAA